MIKQPIKVLKNWKSLINSIIVQIDIIDKAHLHLKTLDKILKVRAIW